MVLIRRFLILLSFMIVLTGVVSCAGTSTSESTGQYLDNTVITAKVKSQLLAELGGESMDIKVKSYKNNVQLSGFVNDENTAAKAEHIASRIQGVRRVQNDILVKPEN